MLCTALNCVPETWVYASIFGGCNVATEDVWYKVSMTHRRARYTYCEYISHAWLYDGPRVSYALEPTKSDIIYTYDSDSEQRTNDTCQLQWRTELKQFS